MEQGNPVDHHGVRKNRCKMCLCCCYETLLRVVRQRAGERHMKTEVFEHIGITPALEIFLLARRKPCCTPARDLFRRGWLAERVKR